MKTLVSILYLIPALLLGQATPKVGDSLEQTLSALGKPVGTIELREKTLLLYPRGEVTLKQDLVVEVDLMTEAQFAADQQRLEDERAQWAMHQKKMAAERREQGEALKAQKLSSTAFASRAAKEKVDYWRRFQNQYPEIDVSPEIADALKSYQSELEELKSQQRLAELEARVAQAEQEAINARIETERLRNEQQQTKQQTYYGLRYYTDPVVHPRYHYRAPTITIYSNDKTNTVPQKKIQRYYKTNRHENEGTAERVSRILNQVHQNK